jgi:serine protease Do
MSDKSRRMACVLAVLLALGAQGGLSYGQRVNPNNTRTSTAIETVFMPVVRTAARSTVRVRYTEGGAAPVQAALGTVVSEDGYILTKASEIIGRDKVSVLLARGRDLDAKIVGYNESLDLAMLKVEAKGLTPVVFADTRPPEPPAAAPGGAAPMVLGPGRGGRGRRGPIPVVASVPAPPDGAVAVEVGQWVATPDAAGTTGTDLPPRSVGVISTARRWVPRRSGFLGIGMADVPDEGGAKITEVVKESAAEDAGLRVDDVVKAFEGQPIKQGAELSAAIRTYATGDAVRLVVQRGKEQMVVRAVLGQNLIETTEDREIVMLSGGEEAVSKRSTFSQLMRQVDGTITSDITLFEHDTILSPKDMGGPLVDLEGRVIGINIARAGRTETFALPADIIVPALERLKSGVFAPLPARPAQ